MNLINFVQLLMVKKILCNFKNLFISVYLVYLTGNYFSITGYVKKKLFWLNGIIIIRAANFISKSNYLRN